MPQKKSSKIGKAAKPANAKKSAKPGKARKTDAVSRKALEAQKRLDAKLAGVHPVSDHLTEPSVDDRAQKDAEILSRDKDRGSLVEILEYVVADDDHFTVMQKMFADPDNLCMTVKEMLTAAVEARIDAYSNAEGADERRMDRDEDDGADGGDDDVRYGEELLRLLEDME